MHIRFETVGESLVYAYMQETHSYLVLLLNKLLWRLFKIHMIDIRAVVAITIMTITTTTPATTEGVLVALLELIISGITGVVIGLGEHSGPSGEEMATEQSESTVILIPVTMRLVPPLTHSSMAEMRVPLSLSEVPSSLAR